jgi:hypothetical protein
VPECGGERKPVAVVLAWLSLGGTELSVMRLAPSVLLHWCYNDIERVSHDITVDLKWYLSGFTSVLN